MPATGRSRTSGIPDPTCEAMSAPTATKPNWPNDTWPDQPVRTVSDRAMMPKIQILRHEEGMSHTDDERQQPHHEEGDPDTAAAHRLAQGGARGSGSGGAMAHDDRSPTRVPFCREAARRSSAPTARRRG